MVDIRLEIVDTVSEAAGISRWPPANVYFDSVEDRVRTIIEMVRQRGDEALIQLSQEYDRYPLSQGGLRVDRESIEASYSQVTEAQIESLQRARERIETVSRATLERLSFVLEDDGTRIRYTYTPLDEIGCYVPGGEANYPSSLLMCVVPARTAGVRRIVVCTPPRPVEMAALTLVAADICGATEVYMVGGAQAIAALAYGTESIRPVQKIVGPGNKYVTAAKRLVAHDIPIDMPAGPSELLVLADDSADPRLIALDMLSQAEHSTEAISALVTDSQRLAERVRDALERLLVGVPREEIIREALRRNGVLYVCRSMDDCIELTNQFAPEHVQVMTRDPEGVQKFISTAGLVLIGPFTPVAASDYGLGVNHVLPTSGYGRVVSGLSVLDFVRRFYVVETTEDGLKRVERPICELARAEGLNNHASAVRGRFSS